MAKCGENDLLNEANDLKGSMKDLMAQGQGALDGLQSKLGELESKLGEFKPELQEFPKLQDLINDLQNSETGTAFSEKYAEIKEKFGEAWDDMDAKLEEMGLGSFPPTLDATTSFLKEKTGIDLDAVMSGDFSSIQAKIDESVENGETPPDIAGIMSGDFSSLGPEVADKITAFQEDPLAAICDNIPKLEEVDGEVVTQPRPSQISTAIAAMSVNIGNLDNLIAKAIDDGNTFREAERNQIAAMDVYIEEWLKEFEGYTDWDEDDFDAEKFALRQTLITWHRVKLAMIVYPDKTDEEAYNSWMQRTGLSQILTDTRVQNVTDKILAIGETQYELHNTMAQEFTDNSKHGTLFFEFYPNYFINKYPEEEAPIQTDRNINSDGTLTTFNINKELPSSQWTYRGTVYTLYGTETALNNFIAKTAVDGVYEGWNSV
jgi:hypothetical protein